MRRSAAPSRLTLEAPTSCPANEPSASSRILPPQGVRSKQSVLELLSAPIDSVLGLADSDPFSFDKPESFKNETASPTSHSSPQEIKRFYEVVYGKPSTKKHKTWDGDGVLIINLDKNTATLKDSNDKILGQLSKFNPDTLEDGKHLNIGGKVVDIVGPISSANQSSTPAPSAQKGVNSCGKRILSNSSNYGPPNKCYRMQQTSEQKFYSGEKSGASKSFGHSHQKPQKNFSMSSKPRNEGVEDNSENQNSTKNVRIYEVVFGKPSTKKHKTWDGDGTLVIDENEKLATLKDENGRVIGTKANFKMDALEAEEYLSIGGKVVDVLNLISGESVSKSQVFNESKKEPVYSMINSPAKKRFKPPGMSDYPKVIEKKEVLQTPQIIDSFPKQSLFTTFKQTSKFGQELEDKKMSCGQPPFPKNETSCTRSAKDILALLSTPVDLQDIDFHLSCDSQSVKEFPFESSKDSESLEFIAPFKQEKNFRTFNVMIAKPSTKKHKTWDEDGILEVNLDSSVAVLKKSNGTVIGQSKVENVKNGSQFKIGSKEVEVLNEVGESAENSQETKTDIKGNSLSNVPNSGLLSKKRCVPLFGRGKTAIYMQNTKPLLLQKPSYDHQWKFNQSHKPVVDVSVEPFLLRVLRDHQREGVLFLYNCVSGIRDPNFLGAILADEMGLGKTLQSISLIWTLLKQSPYQGETLCKRVLVVTPSSLTNNWKNEFIRWLGSHRINVYVVDQKNKARDYCKLPASRNPILIISYEMYVKAADDLKEVNFDLLICDEGHRLKNTSIKVAVCLNKLNCQRRILLTGTPIQNDLQEFYALVNFVNPGILGSPSEFRKHYADPITESRQPDIDESIQEFGEERATELNELTGGFILRRTQDINDKYLPNKHEAIIFCSATDFQQKLYTATVEYWESRNIVAPGSDSGVKHLSVITALKKICNHPLLLKQNDADDWYAQEESLKNFLSNMLPDEESTSGPSLVHLSSKFLLVDGLLKELRSNSKEKVVLVSYFTQTLDLLASLCDENNFKYLRLDGATPAAQRIPIVDRFNSNPDFFVFLLSAKAGGVGLNLVGASRLVLFDSDWNPATDLQAMSRIWRDGQKKSVFIYRLFTTGTIEEKILQRQISKTGISSAVVDPKNTSHVRLSLDELKDLFCFEPDIASSTHNMLNCSCDGSGCVPMTDRLQHEDDEVLTTDIRECQVSLDDEDSSTTSNVLRMNQLMEWDHHSEPFDDAFLQALCLSSAGNLITFVFHNKTTTEVGSQ